ncbi:MAG TPA: hypothetical protein VMT72_05510 [Pseudolabrys sp.]|nr:hypothetical protein [Pseudolabrys sp.]
MGNGQRVLYLSPLSWEGAARIDGKSRFVGLDRTLDVIGTPAENPIPIGRPKTRQRQCPVCRECLARKDAECRLICFDGMLDVIAALALDAGQVSPSKLDGRLGPFFRQGLTRQDSEDFVSYLKSLL